MEKRYKRTLILMCIVFTTSLFSLRKPVNFESPFKGSWYKKALDMCMYVWGDVRALNSVQNNIQPEQLKLYFDALIGRLTQADRYVAHLIKGKMVVSEDDIAYLIHLLGSLNHACRKLSLTEKDVNNASVAELNEQVQCMLSVLQSIKNRLEAVLGPEFILSKIDQMEN